MVLLTMPGCAERRAEPPALVMGEFEDDYGSRYVITDSLWTQGSEARYHIAAWHPAEQYLVARNDSSNPGGQGRWTRVDWATLEDMPPWTWAYCYSAYEAVSAAVAESSKVADRTTLRTGCNGFPFSRMKPVVP